MTRPRPIAASAVTVAKHLKEPVEDAQERKSPESERILSQIKDAILLSP